MLSGYRFLWVQVIFDLPVTEKADRKAATSFRNHLLDLGFDMMQFSVYIKWVTGKDTASTLIKRVITQLPPNGNVNILQITDKQYSEIQTYFGRKIEKTSQYPEQLMLF